MIFHKYFANQEVSPFLFSFTSKAGPTATTKLTSVRVLRGKTSNAAASHLVSHTTSN